jgi:major membrane immunogen (membrane-anchored lipoprotein)
MTHAGMVPVIVETNTSTDGRYELDYRWTMGGDWFVDVTVTLPDGTFARQRFNFTIRS